MENKSNRTRKLDPKLGWLGLLGFAGFLGIWTFRESREVFPFIFFSFFGFFGFFYEGKMSAQLMDERYLENRNAARLKAYRSGLGLAVMALLASSWSWLPDNDAKLAFLTIALSLAFAAVLFLTEYWLYRLDSAAWGA